MKTTVRALKCVAMYIFCCCCANQTPAQSSADDFPIDVKAWDLAAPNLITATGQEYRRMRDEYLHVDGGVISPAVWAQKRERVKLLGFILQARRTRPGNFEAFDEIVRDYRTKRQAGYHPFDAELAGRLEIRAFGAQDDSDFLSDLLLACVEHLWKFTADESESFNMIKALSMFGRAQLRCPTGTEKIVMDVVEEASSVELLSEGLDYLARYAKGKVPMDFVYKIVLSQSMRDRSIRTCIGIILKTLETNQSKRMLSVLDDLEHHNQQGQTQPLSPSEMRQLYQRSADQPK